MIPIAVWGVIGDRCRCSKGADCVSAGKHPRGSWRTDPLDPAEGDNVGYATGSPNGVWVLDVDGAKGYDSLLALVEANGDLPTTRVCQTGSGGLHIYFKIPDNGKTIRNSVRKIADGIDVRGEGGFVVAPPSVHASGGCYTWVSEAEPVRAPDWLEAKLVVEKNTKTLETEARAAILKVAPQDRLTRAVQYASKIPPAVEGEGGDNATWSIGHAGFSFGVAQEDWLGWVERNWNPRCTPPWSADDLKTKIENGYTYPATAVFGWRLVADNPEATDPSEVPSSPMKYFVLESVADMDIAGAWLETVHHETWVNVADSLYSQDKHRWVPLTHADVHRRVVADIHAARADVNGKLIRIALSVGKRDSIAKAIAGLVPSQDLDQFYRSIASGVSLANGVLVIDKMGSTLHDHDNSDAPCVWQYLDVELNGSDDCPNWDRFVAQVIDDPEAIDLVHEYVGVAMLGIATRFDTILLLYGDGANGKSTMLETFVRHCFEPTRVSALPLHEWGKEFSRIALRGKLLNSVSELPPRVLLDTEECKKIISGEPTVARAPYTPLTTFYPLAGHVFSANLLPPVGDSSPGFWRRIRVIRFPHSFLNSKITRAELVTTFETERAGIVSKCLQAASRAIQRGHLLCVDSVSTATKLWRSDSDAVARFLSGCCRPSDQSTATLKKLHQDFGSWYGEQSLGDSARIGRRTFATRVQNMGYEAIKVSGSMRFAIEILDRKDWIDHG